MQHAPQRSIAVLAEKRHRILVGLAGMNDHRPLQPPRQTELGAEDRALDVARREVVMIVETDFANRPCGRRRRKLIADHRRRERRIVGELMGLVRVDADGEARLRPQLLEPRRLCGLRGVAVFENHERPFQTGVTRARHHLIEIGLMTSLPTPADPTSRPAFQPVTIEGEPLSETIIRERR